MDSGDKALQWKRRVLVIGTDGLRPDLVDPELMPTYGEAMKRGTLFTEFYAAYPPHTRVSMTTLTTGAFPGRHGVVSNSMFVPGFMEDGMLQTGNDKHLLQFKSLMGEPFILVPTLGDRLHKHGKRLAVAASSSPGASLLWNLNHPSTVINPASSYECRELADLHEERGPVPEEQTRVKLEKALWAARALIDVHLPNPDNQVMVLWLSEPDASLHDYGLGSPESKQAMQAVDRCVAEVLQAVNQLGLADQLDIFLISDHGHSTVRPAGSLQSHVDEAIRELALDSAFVVSGNNIFAQPDHPPGNRDVAQLAGWLHNQPWCGTVFSSFPDLADLPGIRPIEDVTGPVRHYRMPLLSVSPKWTEEQNEYGVPGTVMNFTSSTRIKSNHGAASPYDLHAFCLGFGPSFKEGHISGNPCHLVDIAPTVCHLAGLTEEQGFDGRVLWEGLKQ